ncbi:hypothetical protein AB4212_58225, partial [Streptomyces sp. 2MCAF27]
MERHSGTFAQVRTDCQWCAPRWVHTAVALPHDRPPRDDRRFVMASTAAARRHRAAAPAPSLTGPASDVHPVLRRASAPPAALDLLAQAHHGLEEAAGLET